MGTGSKPVLAVPGDLFLKLREAEEGVEVVEQEFGNGNLT